MGRKTDRKQISVSLTQEEYEQFTELAFDLRLRKDSDVLKLATTKLGEENGRTIFADEPAEDEADTE